jgi:glycosyltransferase involved in cell wall biosynthesis
MASPHTKTTMEATSNSALTALPASGRIHVLEVVGNAIVGGMEKWVEQVIARLPRDRFVVTALCPFESPYTDRLRAHEVEVLVTPMPEDPPWSSIQMTASLIKAGSIDLLHAHLPNAHLLAGLAGKLTSTPVVCTIHGRQVTPIDLELHHLIGSHLSVVCRQSYFNALGLGVDAAQLSCDINGVDTVAFQPRPNRQGAIRRSLGLAEATPLVGFVGRLSPEKGPEVFVRSALLLHSRMPDAHCVMVGEGPMHGQLQALIAQCGLSDRVHLVGARDDMPEVHNELDVVVSTSHSEAMPLALMEAMASGVPVVATRVGGVPDMVEHGETGWLAARNDFDDVAARVAGLLADPAERARMGLRARRRAVERMNLDDSMARTAALLARIARPRAGTQRRVAPIVHAVAGETPRRTPAGRNGSARLR